MSSHVFIIAFIFYLFIDTTFINELLSMDGGDESDSGSIFCSSLFFPRERLKCQIKCPSKLQKIHIACRP